MKVAIVGAGLSGLCCAYELERQGIETIVFEKRKHVGEILEYPISDLKLFNRYRSGTLRYLQRRYDFKIKPLGKIKKIIMFSPNYKTIIKGKLGYLFIKGKDEKSLENQILSYFNPNITYDSYIDVSDIARDFDYVVVATGEQYTARKYGIFQQTFNALSRIATVVGSFDPNTIIMWLGREFSNNGYCYMVPYNQKKAYVILSVNNITYNELDYYWKLFLTRENVRFKIIETRDVENQIGFVNPIMVDNIYFIGNAGGFIDSFLGFGGINAIESGLSLARCIGQNLDYNAMMNPIMKDIKLMHEYRIMMNGLEDNDYDKILTLLNIPAVKGLLYKNPFYKASYGAHLIRLYNQLKNQKENEIFPQ